MNSVNHLVETASVSQGQRVTVAVCFVTNTATEGAAQEEIHRSTVFGDVGGETRGRVAFMGNRYRAQEGHRGQEKGPSPKTSFWSLSGRWIPI